MFQRPFNYMVTRRTGGPTPPQQRTIHPPPPSEAIVEPRINGLSKRSRMDQLRAALKGTVRVLWNQTSFQSVATFYFDLTNPMPYGRFTQGSFKIRVTRKGAVLYLPPRPDMVWTGSYKDIARSLDYVLFVQTELTDQVVELFGSGPIGEVRVELLDRSFRVLSAHAAHPMLAPTVPVPEPMPAPPASVPAPPPVSVPAPSDTPDPARVSTEPPPPAPAVAAAAPPPPARVPTVVHADDHYAEFTV